MKNLLKELFNRSITIKKMHVDGIDNKKNTKKQNEKKPKSAKGNL